MQLSIQEKFIKLQGVNTHYWEAGDGEPILFIHGGGAGADGWGNWNHLMPKFAEAGYRALALDMVGFGSSDAPDPKQYEYSNDSRVKHVIAFIEALQLPRVHLVGNSMGGAASLGVAIKRPELVSKIILLGSAGRHRPKEEDKSQALKTLQDYEYGWDQMTAIVRSLTNDSFEVKDELIQYRLKFTAKPEVMRAYQATMQWVKENGMYYEDDELKGIEHPVLLIHGKNDKVVPSADSWEIHNLVNNASLYVLPKCGHWVMLEYPEEFTAVSLRFLKNP